MTRHPAPPRDLAADLDQILSGIPAEANIPGVAAAIFFADRRPVVVGSAGWSDVEQRLQVDASTLFEIGSISKSFTAIVALQLAAEGLLSLEATVDEYLPWWQMRSEHPPFTLHHLLTHTAGIIQGAEATPEALSEAVALMATECSSPPGSYFHYSNAGYKVVGLVLEQLTGSPYATLVSDRILGPLGMRATHPAITHQIREGVAVGYEPYFDDQPLLPGGRLARAPWFETATADGCIASTATDMAAYGQMLLNGGRGPGGDPVVPEQGYRLMTTAHAAMDTPVRGVDGEGSWPESGGAAGYGYGLEVREAPLGRVLSHGGGMVGYRAHLLMDTAIGLGTVVLVNGPGDPEPIANRLLATAAAAEVPEGLGSGKTPAAGPGGPPDEAVGATAGSPRPLERRAGGSTTDGADLPTGTTSFVGHYRSHNPWFTNFRVVEEDGALMLVAPGGCEAPEQPEVLIELAPGHFRVGADPRSPERITFTDIIEGRAARADLSGCSYYRTFTP